MKKKNVNLYKDHIKVLIKQAEELSIVADKANEVQQDLDESIFNSEILLKSLEINLPEPRLDKEKPFERKTNKKVLKTWDDLVTDAARIEDDQVDISKLLSVEEIQGVENSLNNLRSEFRAFHRLDKIDWSIAGSVGVISAIVDIFLVQMPKHPGFLGGEANEGGPLSNYIKEILAKSFTPKEISELEKQNWVPYDASHSKTLMETVEGLGPRTHRYQSLGHDPILGFIFGTRDILNSEMTAIDKNGKLIVQSIFSEDKDIVGMNLFEAIARVFGHLKSDISTKSGLPAPLMPLIQFIQKGEFGKQKYTIGEVSRMMYRSGYDFAHFMAMSIPVLIIEVLVRLLYLVKSLKEGKTLKESIPFDTPNNRKPKLQTMLFTAHLLATTANAGKVYLTQNPLSINYPQWILFAKYSFKQANWVGFEKQNKMNKYVQNHIDENWKSIHIQLDEFLIPNDKIIKL